MFFFLMLPLELKIEKGAEGWMGTQYGKMRDTFMSFSKEQPIENIEVVEENFK